MFARFKQAKNFTNYGFLLNKGRIKVTKLINNGVDIILPVADYKTNDIMDVIKNMSDRYVVGLGTYQNYNIQNMKTLYYINY